VKLFRKSKSNFWWYDFAVRGQRYRSSTKETNKARAAKVAALKLAQATEGDNPLPKKAPRLLEFSKRFLEWVDGIQREEKTKIYYRDGWRLLLATNIIGMQLDQITSDVAEMLRFPGSPSNANCALRTLRRMLHKATDWKLILHTPKIRLVKEYGRSITLDEEAEKKLIIASASCGWRKKTLELFQDIIVLIRDTGLRNERELYRIRIENLDWENKIIFVPDSKTEEGRRRVPMSNRAFNILRKRCGNRSDGWLFESKRSKSGHLTTLAKVFQEAREKAGLPKNLVLYCGRHDYGTRILRETGNLAAVMKTMGHRDVKTAMQYQHPSIEIVRAALNHSGIEKDKAATQ
jgi:integrase